MNHPQDSTLGRLVEYPQDYDPGLLFPIPRAHGRAGLRCNARGESTGEEFMPFMGHDRWHAYELSWLDRKGKPVTETATITVPAYSPFLIESKSLKLYLNSFNNVRMESAAAVLEHLDNDLGAVAGTDVDVTFGLPAMARSQDPGFDLSGAKPFDLDGQDIAIDHYGPPDAGLLKVDRDAWVKEVLFSRLLKSNCPVTGQPDWASVRIAYEGPQLEREGLLRYIVSFRNHAEFHEQCVERMFCDIVSLGAQTLSVDARYTRRGGLDINPWRATPTHPIPRPGRDERQ